MVILLSEVEEGASNSRVIGDEPIIEVGEAKEGTHFLDFGGGWPSGNTIKLDRVHGELTWFHNHSKVFNFGDVELAFLELKIEVKLSHVLEDTMGSFGMSFWVRGGNEKVIHIDDKPSFSDHVLERIIHELLEHSRAVAKTEEYDSRFKKSLVGDEGCLPLVAIFDVDVVISLVNVEFGEVVSIFQLVHKVEDEGKGVCIMGGAFVEVVIVLAKGEFAILLFNDKKRGCLRGIGRSYLPSS